jgi:hypothetical protein
MIKRVCTVFAVLAWLLIGAGGGYSQGKFSGYMFGDLYYAASHHDSNIEGRNGFWFRRIYFTYDHGLNEEFAVRFRIEMNSEGNFVSTANLEPYVKDAYLKWTRSGHSVFLGISPTPTFEYFEDFWGYRSVEKTPPDLYRFASSRDFGVAVKGDLGSENNIKYHFMFGNGASTSGSDGNEGKKLMLALAYEFSSNFFVQGYGDWEERPGETNRYTFQGTMGYKLEKARLGFQILRQTRQTAGDDINLVQASGFVVADLQDNLAGFLRYDRLFDAVPDGQNIAYLPLVNTAKANYLLAGVDFAPHAQVHFMPNVEFVFYNEINGVSPDADIIPRLTFYYIWK